MIRYYSHLRDHNGIDFVMFEQWRSLADLEAHLRTEHVAELRATLDKLLVGSPEFEVLVSAG